MCYLLWISLQNFKGVPQGVENLSQCLSSLSDSGGFTKGSCELLVRVHLVVELELENFLTLFHKEIADCFWNRVLNISQNNIEICVDSLSHFGHKHISTSLLWYLWLLLLLLVLTKLILACTSWASWPAWLSTSIFSWNNISPVILIVLIISEEIILLRINDSLYNFSCMISLLAQALNNDIHDLGDHSREPLKDLIDNAVCNLLEL